MTSFMLVIIFGFLFPFSTFLLLLLLLLLFKDNPWALLSTELAFHFSESYTTTLSDLKYFALDFLLHMICCT